MLLSVLVIFSLICSCFAIELSAHSAILYEPKTETVLFEKNADEARAIASTTKIMTAVVVLENVLLSDVVTVPQSCVGVEGTSMYLKKGEKLTVEDLLYGMLLQSGNDAAETLAYYAGGGSREKFVQMMNRTADKIGMKNTSFKNPSGLPDDEHYSTAEDMARLAAYAIKIDSFADIVSTYEKKVSGRYLKNHNKLLKLYDGANGFKTGFTKAAGRCLVSGAEREDMQLIAVTLSAPDDWNDHRKLLDFGFENFDLYSNSQKSFNVDVVGGERMTVCVKSINDAIFLTKKGSDVSEIIYLPKFIYAPINYGDSVGKIEYYVDGVLKDSIEIKAVENVEEERSKTFFDKLFDFFKF